METKHVLCATCDISCQLVAKRREGDTDFKLSGDKANPLAPGAICTKGQLSQSTFEHPSRLKRPLKRSGQRGENKWLEISWEQALDEISAKLKTVVNKYGPEALAVTSGPWNCSTESGMTRRFMNLLGSPNYLSPVALCLGNTAAVNRLTYGWMPFPDFENTNCIVLMGHNTNSQSWVFEYIRQRLAQKRGAKLIVMDPRRSPNADKADIYLPIKPGTDIAMCMGWINVIITEQLYDKDFVSNYTVGFDELEQRVNDDFSLEKVSNITGVPIESIREAARLYATSDGAIIPWSPITDQQVSSTSAIRAISILRAITGNLDAPGGEMLMHPGTGILSEAELELTELLSEEQKQKQLGYDQYPAFTFKAADKLKAHSLRVFGLEYPNLVKGTHMAVPSPTFRAMAYGDPYPVKAFFAIANNALMGYGNQPLIKQAMLNQDLNVCFEQFMTPTAQLCDYVLPGDSWMERPNLMDAYNWASLVMTSEQLYQPPGECRNVYDFWKGLAERMGMGQHFTWNSVEDLFDHRLAPMGMTFNEFKAKYKLKLFDYQYYNYRNTGFATPSGKVELYSSVLEELGCDPLPYYRNIETSEEYPLKLFVGLREPQFFQSGQRHNSKLRVKNPFPRTFIHPNDIEKFKLEANQWATIETINGKIQMLVTPREDVPEGLIRVPHGWWLPEEGADYNVDHNDAVVIPDTDDYLDREQGIPHLKGVPCKIYLSSEQPPIKNLKSGIQ
ncbi:molybdopterin-dependent oxidoreductase [Alteromonas sp. MMG017]|uniref:molybdopterin-containing oxidoreductase family protein n=1 Tax=Alteromonas sp. MMG017 TaxID=2822692 RepID=UPI001B3A5D58|nr:molybdopterin-dependent oxidoreductase [Alteromonas sp. MMG017]MBQ4831354.1 molybdopterin-dependent oxidoreductase [Alteromonas sp. MMG017]